MTTQAQIQDLRSELDASERNIKLLIEALKPFAACNPSRFGSMPPEKTWLWKPNQTKMDLPGISVADIEQAKETFEYVTGVKS